MERRKNIFNIIAIVCAVWFILIGWMWAWLIALFFAYPVAIIGTILWFFGRGAIRKNVNKTAGIMLLAGLIISLGSIFFYR